MKISQSTIKDYFRENTDEGCMHRFKLKYVDGIKPEETDELTAFKKGQLFEFHAIGATRDGSGEPATKKNQNGATPKPVADIMLMAEYAKEIMRKMNIELTAVQPTLETEDRIGHPDAFCKIPDMGEAILDIKYTETKADDRFRGWGDPASMDHTQAKDYVDLYRLTNGKALPFFYLVFGKDGWIKPVRIRITHETLDFHRQSVIHLKSVLKSEKYLPTKSFNTCMDCDFIKLCNKKKSIPTIETVEI